jgi:hypothetical protein
LKNAFCWNFQTYDWMQIHHWYEAHWKKAMKVVEDLIQKDEDLPFNVGRDIKTSSRSHKCPACHQKQFVLHHLQIT